MVCVPATNRVRVARVYDAPSPDDGSRVLVDRLWPRGLTKAAAALDLWCRDIAPSTELRVWFGRDASRLGEFVRRYEAELHDPEKAAALIKLTQVAIELTLTLLSATKDLRLSHAPILARIVDGAQK
jgi:uncharacterized protein YeaO (DUF488 family)